MNGLARLEQWFRERGWTPFPYQRRTWEAARDGRSGLIHVPTGAGKTFAALGGPLTKLADDAAASRTAPPRGLRVLHLSPLRAVARDIEAALRAPIEAILPWARVGSRTGDTSAGERARQRVNLPELLVTTPESLSLILCREQAEASFARLDAVIVDEWHELMASKRGVQTELAIARLRRWRPGITVWGLSATLARPEVAARRLLGPTVEPLVIDGGMHRPVRVRSLLPEDVGAMPWSGHLGLAMTEALCRELDPASSTLVFTNTRAQAERWFMEIMKARPHWNGRVALHHGSIDRSVRERVEEGLKQGTLGIVVATSSLDLGVDFAPVERVVQIGSPKGIARLLQRAGRSAHRPGAACEVLCVPTHAMELAEIAAARQAIDRGEIEARPTPSLALDCLVQHLVTVATGGGFVPDALFDEVRTCDSFAALDRREFDWAVDLVTRGGASLGGTDRFRRVRIDEAGRHRVRDVRIARAHRLNIGTITSEAVVSVALLRGRRIGTIEEDFIAKLRPGDDFVFAGMRLEFVRLHEMTAMVRKSRRASTLTPRWAGSRFPLSTALAAALRRILDAAAHGRLEEPEMVAAAPILDAQSRLSVIPRLGETLLETCESDEGTHLFLYPFEGRLVHEGLAALLALRLGRIEPTTFELSINDYGIEMLHRGARDFAEALRGSGDRAPGDSGAPASEVFTTSGLAEDLLAAVNAGELSARQFREIARVAGLVPQRDHRSDRSARQIQAGASLIFEVFRNFEPSNPLLRQSQREVLDRHFEEDRLARTLERLASEPIRLVRLDAPGPLALPLVADRLGTVLSTETLRERLRSLLRERVGAS